MLTLGDLHEYQRRAVQHCLTHTQAMMWLDLGLGKTITTLTALRDRMDMLQVYGTLVVAPLRVCQTVWAQEAENWEHTRGLTFSRIMGTPTQRHRAMRVRADVYLVNYENLPWLVDELVHVYLSRGQYLPFNCLVLDEITKMKNSQSKRNKALRRILPYIPYRIGLTGEPASNGYKDLFGQYLVIDGGARLGANVTQFRQEFCTRGGYMGYEWSMLPSSEEIIKRRIADITLQMSNEDYLELPPMMINDINVTLDPKTMAAYERLEKEMFIRLDSGTEVEVFNAGALTSKALQAANGALYVDDSHDWDILHDAKLDALEDILEEAGGQPVLCLYEFKHDLARIRKRFPDSRAMGPMSLSALESLIEDWEAGKIPLLCGHPASMGHGLNLQYGGHTIVWYGLNWSLDLYNQANGRLMRQGQTRPVMVHRILAANTMDWAVRDALDDKAQTQTELKRAINEYRNRKQHRSPDGHGLCASNA